MTDNQGNSLKYQSIKLSALNLRVLTKKQYGTYNSLRTRRKTGANIFKMWGESNLLFVFSHSSFPYITLICSATVCFCEITVTNKDI
jgi:hypothetical protein